MELVEQRLGFKDDQDTEPKLRRLERGLEAGGFPSLTWFPSSRL